MVSDDNLLIFLSIIIALNLCLVFLFRFVALNINLLDYPGGRKTHSSPTPLIGGLTIYFTLLAAVGINNDWGSDFAIIVLWAGTVFFIGLVDDFKHVSWPIRLIVQVIAAIGVIFSTNIEITYLGSYPILGALELGPLSIAFTIFAVVGLANAYNLIDGINGLCGGLLLVPIVALVVIGGAHTNEIDLNLLITIISLCIFLVFNLINNPKANLFLGDAGSSGLGFIVSFLMIAQIYDPKLSAAPPLALWLLLVPIMDTIHVIVRRTLKRQSIFQPGSDHLHHRLMKIGYSQTTTFSLLWLLACLGVVIGATLNFFSDIVSMSIFFIVLIFLPILLTFKEKNHD